MKRRLPPHLLVHQDVDDGVEHGAAFGQDGGHHARHGPDEARLTKGGHHGHDAVRHPAEEVARHRGDDHEEDVEFAPPRPANSTHLI